MSNLAVMAHESEEMVGYTTQQLMASDAMGRSRASRWPGTRTEAEQSAAPTQRFETR